MMLCLKKNQFVVLLYFLMSSAYSQDFPARYTGLLDYVHEAPDQGRTAPCLFVASTGAIEIIVNGKKVESKIPFLKANTI